MSRDGIAWEETECLSSQEHGGGGMRWVPGLPREEKRKRLLLSFLEFLTFGRRYPLRVNAR